MISAGSFCMIILLSHGQCSDVDPAETTPLAHPAGQNHRPLLERL